MVLPYIEMNLPRYTCVPHPEPSSLLPPHTIPLGRPSAPAPSIQYHASNLDWWLISCMILYIFQYHSPKSSHPLPLPQRQHIRGSKRHWCIEQSSFTFVKRIFSSSSLSAISMVSSAYLRLLLFLQAILIPACAASSPTFCMMYSAYKLNKQSDSIQPWHTLSQFETSSLFHVWFWRLLLDLHTGFTGDWWGGLVFTTLSEFSTVCVTHIVKGFSVVSEAEVDVFLQFSCFFCDPVDVGNVISGSPVF